MAQTSAKKLEHTRSDEKERVVSLPPREQLASTPEPTLPKGTESSVQSTRSWGAERLKVGESRILAREKEIKAGAWRGKGGLHNEGKGGFKEGKQEEPP